MSGRVKADNLNSNQLGMLGFLTENNSLVSVNIRTDPITDTYTVESRPFARGKFASVRRCRHKETAVDYAAKYIRKRRRATDVRHEILHEVNVLKLCSSCPRIVCLHEVYETPTELILILELASGGELQRVLEEEEMIDEVHTVRLMRQILEGVQFLHERCIAHLDIKPQNLLLNRPFPQGDVKLCDFGISRLITNGADIRELVGTPDYVAPEILMYEPISLATDMWSVGVLAYVLLSGHSPFGGDTKQETYCNITNGEVDFPEEMFEDISNDAKDFISRLLTKKPRDRMTVKECLSHPWLAGTGDKSSLTPQTNGLSIHICDSSESESPESESCESSSPGPESPTSSEPSQLTDSEDGEELHQRTAETQPSLAPVVIVPSDAIESKRTTSSISTSSPIKADQQYREVRKNVIQENNDSSNTTTFRSIQSTVIQNRYNHHRRHHHLQSEITCLRHDVVDHVSTSNNSSTRDRQSIKSMTETMEQIAAELEGISLSKHLMFSDEIIVDERVGMVY